MVPSIRPPGMCACLLGDLRHVLARPGFTPRTWAFPVSAGIARCGNCGADRPTTGMNALLWSNKKPGEDAFAVVERVMGIEPTSKAWEAFVLPLNYTRTPVVPTSVYKRSSGYQIHAW